MANEALRRYLTERLLDLDPLLSDTPGAPMFEKVIDPLIERLGIDPLSVNIEEFILQRIKDDPLTKNLDMESAGSFLKDMFLRPMMVVLEPLQREIEFLKTQQSLANIDSLSKDELDALMANVFETRKFGDFATGVIRVYYSAPQAVSVDASIIFYTASGLQFVPIEPQTAVESDFVRLGDLYFVEFDIQSLIPHVGANVAADQIRFVTGLANVVRVTNPNAMSGGVTEETNTEFTRRAEQSLTERSTNTKRGVQAALFSTFDNIESLDVVGYRDPEMQRDILTGTVTLGLEDTPGEVLHTTATFGGVNIGKYHPTLTPETTYPAAEMVPDWSDPESTFPFTNVVRLTFTTQAALLAVYNKIVNMSFIRVFDTTGNFDEKHIGLSRAVTGIKVYDNSVTPVEVLPSSASARNIWIYTSDFEIVAHGDLANTVPHDNANSDQGTDYYLKNSDDYWRGAPLPFTDIVDITNTTTPDILDDVQVLPERDFLVLRGHRDGIPASGADPLMEDFYRVFPLRSRETGDTVRVRRSDFAMTSRDKVGLPTTYEYTTATAAWSETPEVLTFGAPGPFDETDKLVVFDGVSTVADGLTNQGGVALFQLDDGTDAGAESNTYVEIAADASRPDGWVSLGVEVGQFISLAATDPAVVTSYNTTGKFDWWMWGRISQVGVDGNNHIIKVEGIQHDALATKPLLDFQTGVTVPAELGAIDPNWFGFPTDGTNARYRLHYTVYRGELEVFLQNGNLTTSYDDFAFLPAYDTTGTFTDLNPAVDWVPAPGLHSVHTDAVSPGTAKMYALGTGIGSHPTGSLSNRCNWAIVRLGKRYRDIELDDGTPLINTNPEAQPVDVTTVADKYSENVGSTTAYHAEHLPLNLGAYEWSDVGVLTISYNAGGSVGSPNLRGARGSAIPSFINVGGAEIFQAYGSLESQLQNPVLSITNIPGSIPFPDDFGEPITVNSGEVHIGGMTDVYLKGSGLDLASIDLPLYPKDLDVGSDQDIIVSASDASITAATPKVLSSPTLSSLYTASEMESLINYVVEIVDSSETTSVGKSSRIIDVDHAASTIRVADDLNDTVLDITAEYRIYQQVTTSLDDPKRIWLTGTDLVVPLEETFVTSATGFADVPTDEGTLYINILEGNSAGEYLVVEKQANKLVLEEAMQGPELNVDFEIYTKSEPIDMPLVRFTSVEITSDDGSGIAVPPKNPVGVLAESFSGLNNDPLEYTQTLVLRPAGDYTGSTTDPAYTRIDFTDAGEGAYAQLYSDPQVDWAALGVGRYDVVKISGVGEADTFWFVRDITGTGGGADDTGVLLLDRDLSGTRGELLSGTVGKPSLGEVKVYFTEPTYCEVTPDTIIRSKDGLLSFRPSPAEESDVYETPYTSTDVTITPVPSVDATLTSSTLDFSRLDIRVGDRVEITRIALLSSDIPDATAADMSTLINKALVVTVDSVQRSMLFTSTGTLTLNDVVNQINDKLGGFMRAANIAGVAPATRRLALYSSSLVEIQDSSPGVLTTLGLTNGQDNNYTFVTAEVTDVDYNAGTGVSTLTLEAKDNTVFTAYAMELFFKVVRPENQLTYPADMVQDDNGLWYFEFTASSRFPLENQRVAENTLMDIENFISFGYELIAENESYTFSDAERTDIRVTPVILADYATSFNEAFICPTASIGIEYQRSQLVEDIQSYLLQDTNRVVNNNPLARHYLPAYLHLSLITDGGKDVEDLKSDLVKYLLSLFPNKTLEAYDIERVMVNGGVEFVQHPINLTYIVHNADRTVEMLRSDNAITLDSKYHIMEDDENITITRI